MGIWGNMRREVEKYKYMQEHSMYCPQNAQIQKDSTKTCENLGRRSLLFCRVKVLEQFGDRALLRDAGVMIGLSPIENNQNCNNHDGSDLGFIL